jgi:hypothetical protein
MINLSMTLINILCGYNTDFGINGQYNDVYTFASTTTLWTVNS